MASNKSTSGNQKGNEPTEKELQDMVDDEGISISNSTGTGTSNSGRGSASGNPGKSGSSSGKSPSGGGVQGGTPEQHAEAGRQSHKNDKR